MQSKSRERPAALRLEVIARARKTGAQRKSIDKPAQEWLDQVADARRLAVLGVTLRDLDDLAALHGYVREPALRSGIELAIRERPAAHAALSTGARQRTRLDEGGRILDALAAITDAGQLIRFMPGPGGLDDYFGEWPEVHVFGCEEGHCRTRARSR